MFPATQHKLAPFNDRAVFVVDKQGKIAWFKVYPAPEQPDIGEVLGVLGKLA